MAEETTTVRLSLDARGVARVTLARPEVHNAFDERMIAELHEAARRIADGGARVAVLTGEGRSFSAGADIRWFRRQVEATREERIAGSTALGDMLSAFDRLPCPLIGRINGQAFGGGLGLIAVCDIAIAAATARFAMTETKIGLVPANISPFVIARIGVRHARRTMLSGRMIGAAEAAEIGLVDRIAAPEVLDDAVEEEIGWAFEAAPGAAAATKALIREIAAARPEDRRAIAVGALADAWETEEGREGIAAFLEKRAPSWKPGG